MRMRSRAVSMFGFLTVLSFSANAVVISSSDLPDAVAGCNGASCQVGLTSIMDASNFSIFGMGRQGGSSSWLLRYTLATGSAKTSVVDQSQLGGSGVTTTVTPYQGYLWMEAPVALDFNGINVFKVYTDKASPDPDESGDGLSTWAFGMQAADAIAGGAFFSQTSDDGIHNPQSAGALQVLDGLPVCVECGFQVSLNLVGLGYHPTGGSLLGANPTTAQFMQYDDFFDYFDNSRAFYVQPVPLPAAAWLLVSGLLAFVGITRRRKESRV